MFTTIGHAIFVRPNPRMYVTVAFCRQTHPWDTKYIRDLLSSIFVSISGTPNNSAYIDVIAHFLNAKKELRTVVLAARNIHGDHSRKNQAKAIFPVIDEYALKEKFGYFIKIKLLPTIYVLPRLSS